ncbi:MAG: DNA-directed RNA polymerase subunit alpha [bacterium]
MILLPFQAKIIDKQENRAVFQVEGLWPGYGVTVGNSLRRVLLSSLDGAAVTQMKISGVQHEFSTIPGVVEDVISLSLNVRQLRFKIHSDEPVIARINIKGEKEITGKDIETPSQLEVISRDIHIATLTDKNAKLEMELTIEKGLGYQPKELQKKEKTGIGEILLDAYFTPIKKVGYHVENMRVGKRTDFDRLRLEIETDGSIDPENALEKALDILEKHFEMLKGSLSQEIITEPEGAVKDTTTPKVDSETEKTKKGIVFLEGLGFSSRTLTVLLKNKIKTTEGLLRKNEDDVSDFDGMGGKGLIEIKKILKKHGLALKEDK